MNKGHTVQRVLEIGIDRICSIEQHAYVFILLHISSHQIQLNSILVLRFFLYRLFSPIIIGPDGQTLHQVYQLSSTQ